LLHRTNSKSLVSEVLSVECRVSSALFVYGFCWGNLWAVHDPNRQVCFMFRTRSSRRVKTCSQQFTLRFVTWLVIKSS